MFGERPSRAVESTRIRAFNRSTDRLIGSPRRTKCLPFDNSLLKMDFIFKAKGIIVLCYNYTINYIF